MTASSWRTDAACRDEPLETFFAAELVTRAKQICAGCSVSAVCRAEAVAGGAEDGVWGGWTPEERRLGSDRPIRTLRTERRRRSDLVTPVCRTCDAGLAFPIGASPGQEPAAGVFAYRTDGSARYIGLVRDDLRLRPAIDGSCSCPSCGTVVGRRRGDLALLDEAEVDMIDTRARQRRILAAS